MIKGHSKNIIRIVLVTVLILLVPLVAMQFTGDVKWDLSDFIIIGALLISIGLIYEFIAKNMKTTTHRIILAVVLTIVLFLIWAELAVGIFETPFGGQ